MRQYYQQFTLAYTNRMGDMVEERMRKAIVMVGSIWFTAWVNARQPDLDTFGEVDEEQLAKEQKEAEDAYQKREIKGRSHDD